MSLNVLQVNELNEFHFKKLHYVNARNSLLALGLDDMLDNLNGEYSQVAEYVEKEEMLIKHLHGGFNAESQLIMGTKDVYTQEDGDKIRLVVAIAGIEYQTTSQSSIKLLRRFVILNKRGQNWTVEI
jgi:hypothetical protein